MSKNVLITGATSGIGEATARAFAKEGENLILTGRRVERLEALKEELQATYPNQKVWTFALDVTDMAMVKDVCQAILKSVGQVHVLVNNAGLALGLTAYQDYAEWDMLTMLDTNIKALLAMTRLVVPGMVERGRGHVINMGSIAGDYAYPGGSVYCASKAAVKALSDGLRIDLVDTPVRVTNIKPGLVETNFSVVRFRGDKAAADNVYKGIRPLTGDDIAEVVYFAAAVPEHIQVAEVLVMPTNQATGTIVSRK